MPARSNWKHERVHFYKYVTADAALKILTNRTLKYSSPLLFNDPFDIQFDLHFGYDRDAVISAARDRYWAIYTKQCSFEPKNDAGEAMGLLRDKLPGMTRAEFEENLSGLVDESLNAGEAHLPRFHAEFRDHMRDIKVLCLSEKSDNLLMWSHYADCHKGVVLRFSCIPELDSVWGAAEKVRYQQEMPRLISQDEMVLTLTGEFDLSEQHLLNKVVLTKAADWSYEAEWRVVLHMTDPEVDAKFIRFAPEELSAIYFGCRTTNDTRSQISTVAMALNPKLELYRAFKSATDFAIEFELTEQL